MLAARSQSWSHRIIIAPRYALSSAEIVRILRPPGLESFKKSLCMRLASSVWSLSRLPRISRLREACSCRGSMYSSKLTSLRQDRLTACTKGMLPGVGNIKWDHYACNGEIPCSFGVSTFGTAQTAGLILYKRRHGSAMENATLCLVGICKVRGVNLWWSALLALSWHKTVGVSAQHFKLPMQSQIKPAQLGRWVL